MKILLAKTAGFCGGVETTVNKARIALEENKKVYSLGEIVHNEFVINKLKGMGMITVDNIDDIPDGSVLIIRAHGEGLKTYERALKKRLKIIDLTCGKVKAIHHIIEKEKKDSFIVIIGKKNHPETIAHRSYARPAFIVENEDDVLSLLSKVKKGNIKKLYIVAQTTFNSAMFDKLVEEIKLKCPNKEIIVNKTICNATKLRQDEACELAKKVDKMLIIGGKNSSNTKELYEVAKEVCPKVYLIQDEHDLKKEDFSSLDTVGISAGASTPKEIIFAVENFLKMNIIEINK